MIDPQNFRASREAARARLEPCVAAESFGYFIDVADAWETYRTPEEMLPYLGIHLTHKAQYPEIIMDLGQLCPAELDWAKRYLEFYDRIGRLLCTTSTRPPMHFDIAETTFDWRTIQSFVDLPARILDYGAGGGRQCVSAFLRHPDNIYTAVDSTLAAYTVQNLVFSTISALGPRRTFVDLLDLEYGGEPFPDIAKAEPGSIFHVPAWFDQRNLPERFYDVVIACHVHGELSRSDFLRLMSAVDRCLADEGVLYVRSELAIPFPKGYFDLLDMHGMDIVAVLAERNIVPASCTYDSAFQTTVFCRAGSSHDRRARASGAREHSFGDIRQSMETFIVAGRHFAHRNLEWIAASGKRTLFCGQGFDIFQTLIAPHLDQIPNKLVLTMADDPSAPDIAHRIRQFDPEIIVASSSDFFGVADRAVEVTGREFAIRVHHVMPMCFVFREFRNPIDPAFSGPLYVAGDIERNLGHEAHLVAADGARLFGPAGAFDGRARR